MRYYTIDADISGDWAGYCMPTEPRDLCHALSGIRLYGKFNLTARHRANVGKWGLRPIARMNITQ